MESGAGDPTAALVRVPVEWSVWADGNIPLVVFHEWLSVFAGVPRLSGFGESSLSKPLKRGTPANREDLLLALRPWCVAHPRQPPGDIAGRGWGPLAGRPA